MIQLRQYQRECVASVFDYYSNGGGGNIVLALPTGTGKSLVLAELIRLIFHYWPSQRVIALTHVKELIEQNANEMLNLWPHAPLGIYSAGLGRRDTLSPIIYGGRDSVKNCVDRFGYRDLMFIDEAHLLSPDDTTVYRKIIDQFRIYNPHMKVIGLTATMFRLGQGLLTQGGLFDDCPFNICTVDGFARLIAEGYLCPPIPHVTKTEIDLSQVKIQAGEYVLNQLQAAVDKPNITQAALRELCEVGYAQNRRAWLLFSTGIDHADNCTEVLNQYGVAARSIHTGKTCTADQRTQWIKDFRAGKLRALVNNNVLTTGFNDPRIDLIGMLRPTVSPNLWVQMLGRGTRPFEGYDALGVFYRKLNCLVMDYAGNSRRLGPIDDPQIPSPKGKGTGDMPVKICDCCGAYNHTRVRFCIDCGNEFTFQQKITRKSETSDLLSGGAPVVETYDISRVTYSHHESRKGNQMVRVDYHCGLQRFSEYINFEGVPMERHKANEWWRTRSPYPPPVDNETALNWARAGSLRAPLRVRLIVNRKYPEITGVTW